MSQAEKQALRNLWVRIAPKELYDVKATALEEKGRFELTHDIPGFFGPDMDEGTLFEDSLQAERESYMIWK